MAMNEYGERLDSNGYAPSILSKTTTCCLICGRYRTVRHEVFYGPFRDKSKRLGLADLRAIDAAVAAAEKRADSMTAWRTTKPDTDNLEKALKDEMTRLHFWADDAQVCSEIVEKFWADPCGVFVRVEEAE